MPPRPRRARRLRGHAARPRVADRAPRAGYALELLPILPLNGRGAPRGRCGASWPCPRALFRAAALVRRLRPRRRPRRRRLRGRPGRARGRAPGSAHGDPRAEREARLHEPGPAALRGERPPAPTRRRAGRFGSKGVLTGNPVRGRLRRAAARRSTRRRLTLLAFGGSQGSRILNRALVEALPHLPRAGSPADRPPDGRGHARRGGRGLRRGGPRGRGPGLPRRHGARASRRPTSSSRAAGPPPAPSCTAAGKAAVLVPFARAADDHQRTNARAMEAAGRGADGGGEGPDAASRWRASLAGAARRAGPARRRMEDAARAAGPSRRRGPGGGPAGGRG